MIRFISRRKQMTGDVSQNIWYETGNLGGIQVKTHLSNIPSCLKLVDEVVLYNAVSEYDGFLHT